MAEKRLKALRDLCGLTQLQVQMQTGIDQSDYSKLEREIRYPTIEQAKVLAELFDTSLDYIYYFTDEVKPYPRNR